MNALHTIPYLLDKLHAPCHAQSCRTDSFLHDGHFVCANHCISECRLCLLFLHEYHSGDTLEYLDCAMSSTSSNYKSIHDNHFHGDEVFNPRSDLSQGRGDDAEHPTIIPMYTQAYAFGPKVNSLLSESSLSTCKTWMLLRARTLCILRYTRGDHGEPKDQGQACAEAKEGEGRRASCYSGRTSGPSPDIRPLPRKSGIGYPENTRKEQHSPDIRPPCPGHPAPLEAPDIRPLLPEIRPLHHRMLLEDPGQPGHPASQPGHPARPEAPDIRPVARTSGHPCA